MSVPFVSLLAVVVLAAVHFFAGRLRFLEGTPRSVWLSMAGGVSIAYVFVHLFPDLAEGQEALREALGEELAVVERHVYLLALFGLAAFHGQERAAITSRRRRHVSGGVLAAGRGVFRLQAASFAAYNALLGELLRQREEEGGAELVALVAVAMGPHLVVNDFGLHERHKEAYGRTDRWVLAARIVFGWVVGCSGRFPRRPRCSASSPAGLSSMS